MDASVDLTLTVGSLYIINHCLKFYAIGFGIGLASLATISGCRFFIKYVILKRH